jgi:ketosteroid isomerase-like protein
MLLRALALAAVVVAAGCGGSGEQAASTGSDLPPGCGVDETERVVRSFLAAVTQGDRAALRKVVADDLRLFEVHDGRGAGAQDVVVKSKAKALAYLERRIRARETLRLVNLQVQPGGDANHVLVTYTLTRLADDFRARGIPNRVATGDGLVDCVDGTVEGWSVHGP